MTFIYGCPIRVYRRKFWYFLECISMDGRGRCLYIGDFNSILDQFEKRGGNVVTESQVADMHHFMESKSLMDLESKGLYFTWFNK